MFRFRFVRISFVAALATIVGGSAGTFAETRSQDGSGNNVANPQQGAAGISFIRLATSDYGDGLSTLAGSDRPSARTISNMLGQVGATTLSERGLTSLTWQWGQFIDHDIALTHTNPLEPAMIPVTDPGDNLFPVIPMARSQFDPSTGTSTPRQQINSNSSYLDASMVYGVDSTRATALRTLSGGLLKTSAGNLMPYNTGLLDNANDSGIEADADLFLAGDRRANEQPGLIAMHTLFVREHNRLATELSVSNSTWSDEQLYQHARRMVSGMVQSVTYNEFLPALMGSLAPTITAYDVNVDASLSNEFATAAFRFGHTQVTNQLLTMDEHGQSVSGRVVSMAEAFFRPSLVSASEHIDHFLSGLRYQIQNRTDVAIIEDLRSMLFGPPGAGGMDLFALNVQRGRDHGLPSYSDVAEQLGLDRPDSFADLTTIQTVQDQLADAYDSVDDVDLWVGLLAADKVADSEFGLLMNLILQDEFTRLMEGDRFFFAWDPGLSSSEIQMIQDTRLSDIIARNTGMNSMSGNVFVAATVVVPEPGSLFVLITAFGIGVLRRQRRK